MTWHKRTDWGSTPLPQGVQTQHPAPRIRTSCLVEIIRGMENNKKKKDLTLTHFCHTHRNCCLSLEMEFNLIILS